MFANGTALSGGELLMGGGGQAQAEAAAAANRSRSGSGSAPGSGSGGSTPANGPSANFDLSNDFPTLGGGGGGAGLPSAPGGDSLAAALRQQQMQYRIATAGQGSINIAAEDFPALPGSGSEAGGNGNGNAAPGPSQQRSNSQGSGGGGNGNAPSAVSSPFAGSAQAVSRTSSSGTGVEDAIGGSNPLLNGLAGGLAGLSLGGSNNSQQSNGTKTGGGGGSSNPSSGTGASGDAAAGAAIDSDYGLLGLLRIIRLTDADRNALALGEDLSTLGLDVKSGDKLFDNFGGPFTAENTSKDPNYHIPMCYYMNPPALKTGHLAKFTLEILFYIFYAMPKDVLQAYAAQELYTKEWRYHADLKLWFKRAVVGDGVDLSDGTAKYIYFDYQSWDRRHFNGGNLQQIVSGFLSEEDVRVKFPTNNSS